MINKLNKWDLNCSVFNSYDFDDCMSLNELLCRFFTKINECIEASNKSLNLLEWLHEVGLKQEVVTLLGQWKDDGTLAELISEQILTEIKQNIANNQRAITELQAKDTEHDNSINELQEKANQIENVVNELNNGLINGDIPKIGLKNKLLGCSLYYPYDSSQYGSYTEIIDKMFKMNCNYLQFSPILKMETENSNVITSDLNLEFMNEIISYAKSLGMKVCLKCHIKANGLSGHSHIRPTDTVAWIQSLKNITIDFLKHFKNNVDIVSLANECRIQTSTNKEEWIKFNNDVKELGYKTTLATTNDEFTENVLKDIVDYLGLNMYIGIDYTKIKTSNFENMFYNDINHDNDDYISLINNYCIEYGKKCIITEIGILPCLENYYSPAIWTYQGEYSEIAQSNYLTNALNVVLANSNIEGVSIWNVCDGFTILDRISETTVKNIYGGIKNV